MNGPSRTAPTRSDNHQAAGFAFGLGAYGLWGVLPIYFEALRSVPVLDIVAHRVLWSLPLLAILIFVSGDRAKVRAAIVRPGTVGMLLLTAILIGGNWLLYIYAVPTGHILAASFGYYLNPLANVLLGRFVLREKLSGVQWAAVAIAAVGIGILAAGALGQLWLSLAMCISFALYGLLRKIVPADALTGLAIETAILFPLAVAWLGWMVIARAPCQYARHRAAAARRIRFDNSAAALHRGGQTAALFDARHASVSNADAAVPDRPPRL